MKNIKLGNLLTKGRSMVLACDQGFEHGPADFNSTNIDPEYVMDIGLEGNYNALAIQAGVAEKHYGLHYKDVPLLVKLNAKVGLPSKDPYSRQHTSVDYAIKLGAQAVGYTFYHGSLFENEQFVELGKIVEQAHSNGLPVVVWNYPRGSLIKDELGTKEIAYGARVAMELGADMIKLKYNGDKEGFKWIVQCAGRSKVLISGGAQEDERAFLQKTHDAIQAGATGIAVGRNVWQYEQPYKMSHALKDLVIDGKSVDQAMKRFHP